MNLQLNPTEMKIRIARLGVTQRELAKQSAISCHTLSHAMNGKRVSPVTVGRISAALGCDPTDILASEGG